MTASPLPTSFADAITALDAAMPVATKQYLLSLDEAGLEREHWGLGLAVRNVLGLWRDDAPLTQWFEARGFVHAADISATILRAYWRSLHGLPPEEEPRREQRPIPAEASPAEGA